MAHSVVVAVAVAVALSSCSSVTAAAVFNVYRFHCIHCTGRMLLCESVD